MKNRKIIAAAVAVAVVLGLGAALGLAQDKSEARREAKVSLKKDMAKMERDIERALIQIDSLRGLKVRIRGPRDFKLDVDIKGLGCLLSDLERWGESFDRHDHRRLTEAQKRKLRRALKRLEDLEIDLDLDFDIR